MQDAFRAEAAAAPPDPSNVRILKRIVYILGILLVVGTLALIGGIVWKAGEMTARAPAGFGTKEIAVPSGAAVRHLAFDGDRLAMTIDSGSGSEILIVDPRSGVLVGRIRLTPGAGQ